MRKRINNPSWITLFVVVLLGFSFCLTGCGSSANTTKNSDGTWTYYKEYKIYDYNGKVIDKFKVTTTADDNRTLFHFSSDTGMRFNQNDFYRDYIGSPYTNYWMETTVFATSRSGSHFIITVGTEVGQIYSESHVPWDKPIPPGYNY